MRKFAPLPKSILLVEILGMGLLTLAWLSLNQYVQLPAPIVAPQLTHSPEPESLSDREKRNDADH